MKKIVALVLSLVMVLGLATTAFGAITLWAPNGSTVDCDIFEAAYNTKVNETDVPVKVTYNPGTALEFNLDGTVKTTGVIAHYTLNFDGIYYTVSNPGQIIFNDPAVAAAKEQFKAMADALGLSYDYATYAVDYDAGLYVMAPAEGNVSANFVRVYSIPADANAADYVLVKAHNPAALKGATMVYGQTAADAYYILKKVDAITYQTTAEAFTAWSNDCEAYPAPLNAATVDYYTVANKTAALTSTAVKYAEAAATSDANAAVNALVGDEVVTLNAAATVKATQHAWLASKWDAKKVPVEYTCNTCKTVGTVVNSPVNAPAGAKLDNFLGTLIAYNFPAAQAPAGDKVESAQTFDAGIAMYVGMSVMAAAGSAVVLKKKD